MYLRFKKYISNIYKIEFINKKHGCFSIHLSKVDNLYKP